MEAAKYSAAVDRSIWIVGSIAGAFYIGELVLWGSYLGGHYPPWLQSIPLICITAVYVSFVATRRIFTASVAVAGFASAIASALILSAPTHQQGKDYWAWTGIALLVPVGLPILRRAIAWIAGTAVAILICSWAANPQAMSSLEAFIILRGTVTGIAAALLVAALRTNARKLDRLRSQQRHEAELRQQRTLQTDQWVALGRLLHNTVINTLQAIRQGIPNERSDELQFRCRQDLNDIERAIDRSAASASLHSLRARMVAAGRVRGLDIDWAGPAEIALTAENDQLLTEILIEALNNVAKHSMSTHATITVDVSPGGCEVAVVDSGVGFDPEVTATRGIDLCIRQPAKAAGLRATVESASGAGCRVRIVLPPITDGADVSALWPHTQVRLFAWANFGLVLVQFLLQPLPAWPASLAIGLILALYASAIAAALHLRSRSVRTAAFAVVVVCAAAGTAISQLGVETCSTSGSSWLGPTAALPAMVIAGLVIRSYTALFAVWLLCVAAVYAGAAAGLLTQACATAEHVLAASEVLYLAFLTCMLAAFRLSVRQAALIEEQAAADRWVTLNLEAKSAAYWQRLELARVIATPVLTRLDTEPAFANDERIRERAAIAEQLLRSIAQAPPMPPEINDRFLSAIAAASAKPTRLTLSITDQAGTAVNARAELRDEVFGLVDTAVAAGTESSSISVTIGTDHQTAEVLLVANAASDLCLPASRPGLSVTAVHDDLQFAAVARWEITP